MLIRWNLCIASHNRTIVRVIYCAGEQGRVVLDILLSTGEANDVVFADDDSAPLGESAAGGQSSADSMTWRHAWRR